MSTATPRTQIDPPWTIRGLIAGHKRVAGFAAATVVAMVALIVIAVVGGKGGAVTDATTCDQWGSANVNQQNAYARLYVREHGPVPRWGSSPALVINAINAGCYQAYGDDVSETTSLVQAISGKF